MGAPALLRWVQVDAAGSLGSSGNGWLRVIEVASKNAARSRDADDRAIFREAALTALELAERANALPAFECARRKLGVRALYIRQSSPDPAWLRTEASSVFKLFLASLPVDIDSASRLLERERNFSARNLVDRGASESMFQVRALLKPLCYILNCFESHDRAVLQRWMDLMGLDATLQE